MMGESLDFFGLVYLYATGKYFGHFYLINAYNKGLVCVFECVFFMIVEVSYGACSDRYALPSWGKFLPKHPDDW